MKVILNIAYFFLSLACITDAIEIPNVVSIEADTSSVFVYLLAAENITDEGTIYEINSLNESVVRQVSIPGRIRDLALHSIDRKLYCSRWDGFTEKAEIVAIDLDSFLVNNTFEIGAPYDLLLPNNRNVLAVHAGGVNRLIVEDGSYSRSFKAAIFDTNTGELVADGPSSGAGEYDPDFAHYYHGTAFGDIRKYDVTADSFVSVDSVRGTTFIRDSFEKLVISHDEGRIFWNGNVFDRNLNQIGVFDEWIYETTRDGRYAFGFETVFDLYDGSESNLPGSTTLRAYNTTTEKLISVIGTKISFLPFRSNSLSFLPLSGEILNNISVLDWPDVPSALYYQVYLQNTGLLNSDGRSIALLETVSESQLPLSNTLATGEYIWRVDAVTPAGIVAGSTLGFTISPVLPDRSSIQAVSLAGDPEITINFAVESETSLGWVATSPDSWVELSVNDGFTPANIVVSLNASSLVSGKHESFIEFRDLNGDLFFNIPIQLDLGALNLTHLVSDMGSSDLFGISKLDEESTYLIKIDSAKEEIVDVVRYEKKITDINFHGFDDALYALSPEENVLYSINMEDLSKIESLPLPDLESQSNTVRRFAPASPGHVVTSGANDLELCDLATGQSIARARAYGDALESAPNSNLVYLSQSSGFYPSIHVFDTSLGTLKYELPGYARFFSFDPGFYVDYDGDPSLVISDDSSRLFWNGYVIDSFGTEEWEMDDVVYGCTEDGRYAFTGSTIYDVLSKQAILGMPDSRKIFEYNTTSQKLVLQEDERITFYSLAEPFSLVSPDLKLTGISADAVELSWTDASLETEFIIEYRKSGESEWHEFSESIGMNVTTGIFSGLEPSTNYEMRTKAVAYAIESEWSAILEVQTLDVDLGTPEVSLDLSYLKPSTFYPANVYVYLDWPSVDGASGYRIERSVEDGPWSLVDSLDQNTLKFDSGALSLGVKYAYRVRAFDSTGFSLASETFYHDGSFTRLPEVPEYFFAITESKSSIRLIWAKTLYEHGYTVERWNGTFWDRIGYLSANVTEYLDTDVVEGQTYRYRVYGTGIGSSQKSNEDFATARDLTPVVSGDQILAYITFTNLVESDGIVSLMLSEGSSDSRSITYCAKLEATLSFDSETLKPEGITFSNGLILSSDWSLGSRADVHFTENNLTLLSDLVLSSTNIKQRLLTDSIPGTVDTSGYIIPEEHTIRTFSGIVSSYLQPLSDENYYYESIPLVNENFEIESSDDTFYRHGEVTTVQVSFNQLNRSIKAELSIDIDNVFEVQIPGTDSSFVFSESSQLDFSTHLNLPSLYQLWAIENGVTLEDGMEKNLLGVPYALNYAFNQSPDAAAFPMELQFLEDNNPCVCLNLPKDGLLASLIAYYTDDLGSNSWEPLNLVYYLDGASSLDKGQTGLARFEFPDGDQGFIRFVVDFGSSDISAP